MSCVNTSPSVDAIFGAPASPNQDNSGTHILVLARGITDFGSYSIQGCGYQAFLWQATESTILVIGLYLKTGETLQRDTSASIVAKVLALLEQTTHPYVVIGDWQNHPDSVASTVLPAKFHFGILAPDCSLLSGNVIDYAILQDTLASATALTTEWAVPWRPRALLKLQFNIEEATREYRQMQHLPPMPKVPDIDFRPWTTYQSTAYELELYGVPPNQPAQAWADWVSKAEQYLLQENPWAPQGRGSNLRAVHKPLVAQAAKHNWKRGKPACVLGSAQRQGFILPFNCRPTRRDRFRASCK